MERLTLLQTSREITSRNVALIAVAIAAFALVGSAKSSKVTGKMVAYDVMRHASKSASAVQNEEAVVLETVGRKQKYAKVVFSSPGTTQIEQKYFDGSLPLTVDAFRDHSCDESAPRFVREVSVEQMGGTYLLTDAFKNQPPARIKTLECYVAIYRTKKKK
ncbi:MAG TPA: hypothetical protein VMU05_07360 [Dongiaceae bacterium]|nr:hypothetical protein [Dongiaceae bacterium]